MFAIDQQIESFISEFEACKLPKARWTHEAHLLVGLWYLSHHSPAEALDIVRARIRAHNESVGTANTDTSGYHETLTRLYLDGIAAFRDKYKGLPVTSVAKLLMESPLANSAYPFVFYSKARLFSVKARHEWVEPDLLQQAITRRN
jgi:hypothetical protein